MGRYRKIDTRAWSDQKVCNLSVEGKLFFLYLLTSPHSTAWGAYVLPDLYVQADLGFSPQQIKRCWSEVVREQLANRDEPTKLVCFPNWFKYNPPENQKTAAACINGILSMPRSSVLSEFCVSSEWVREQLANRKLPPPELPPNSKRTTTESLEGEQRTTSNEHDKDLEQRTTSTEAGSRTEPVVVVSLPEWMPLEPWQQYLEHRKALKRRLSPGAQKLTVSRIEKLRAQGHDPEKLLNLAVERGWQGIFANDETRTNVVTMASPRSGYLTAGEKTAEASRELMRRAEERERKMATGGA